MPKLTPEDFGAVKAAPQEKLTPERFGAVKTENVVAPGESAPFMAKFAVSRADNPEEAKLALEKMYGKGNAYQDEAGDWHVKDKGKDLPVFAQGQKGSWQRLGSSAVATAAPTAGVITGMGVGTALGGPIGTVVGAGLGYVAGKGADEATKAAQGIYAKKPIDEAGTLASGAAANALFAGFPDYLSNLSGSLGKWFRESVFGVEPSGARMSRKMLDAGARPPIASVAPKAKVFQYDQLIRNLISGNPMEERNVAYIESQMKRMLMSHGYTEEAANVALSEIKNKTQLMAGESEAGRLAMKYVNDYVAGLAKSADSDLVAARTATAAEGAIYKKLASQSGPIAEDVAAAIKQSRTDFGRAMGRAYERLGAMTANAPIIGTSYLKRSVQEQMESMEPSAVPAIYKRILKLPDRIPVIQAHALRSELRQASLVPNLTPGAVNFRFGELADATDAEFRMAAKSVSSNLALDLSGSEAKSVKDIVSTMDKIDAMYAQGVAKYKDAALRSLVNSMKSGVEPDAAVTARVIAQSGYTERTREILKMMDPALRRKVAAADMSSMFEDASRLTPQLGHDVKGRALLDVIEGRRDLIREVYQPIYGKDFVTNLEKYARDLAAVDGKVDVKELSETVKRLGPGAVPSYLESRLVKLNEIDAVVKDNFLGSLVSKDPAVADRAYRLIVKPGEEERLKSAVQFFGTGSDTVRAIRTYALKDALSSAVVEMPSSAQSIAGTALDSYLSKFTKSQQELLFPNGLADDMRTLSKESRFLFPWMTGEGGRDMGASLQAASIKSKYPWGVSPFYRYWRAKFFGYISDRPWLIRAFAGGLKAPDTATRKATKEALFRVGQAAINAHMGASEEPPPQPEGAQQ